MNTTALGGERRGLHFEAQQIMRIALSLARNARHASAANYGDETRPMKRKFGESGPILDRRLREGGAAVVNLATKQTPVIPALSCLVDELKEN